MTRWTMAKSVTLSASTEKHLWQLLGADSSTTWLTDSRDREYNCVGVAARTRDWARLRQLVAQRGRMLDRQVVSSDWIDECARLGRA